MDFIPYISINPSRISVYSRPHGCSSHKTESQVLNEQNLLNNETLGLISHKAKTKIKTAIDWLVYLSSDKKCFSEKHGKHFKFKLTFVTLTLASKQIHSDNEIKKELLNHFLVVARQKWKVDKYLWRAEAQTNGNIHFHLVTDKFIPWDELQKTWNKIQNKLGYVDNYAIERKRFHLKGFKFNKQLSRKWNFQKQRKAYQKGISEAWQCPNSTDIHSIKNIGNLSSYLAKYCSKNDVEQAQNIVYEQQTLNFDDKKPVTTKISKQAQTLKARIIDGKLWGLSQNLSRLKSAIEIRCNEIDGELHLLLSKFKNKIKYYDYNTNLYVPVKLWSKCAVPFISAIFNEYVQNLNPL